MLNLLQSLIEHFRLRTACLRHIWAATSATADNGRYFLEDVAGMILAG